MKPPYSILGGEINRSRASLCSVDCPDVGLLVKMNYDMAHTVWGIHKIQF